jgi:hypothetical protein
VRWSWLLQTRESFYCSRYGVEMTPVGLEISLSFHLVRISLHSVDLEFWVLLVSPSMVLQV